MAPRSPARPHRIRATFLTSGFFENLLTPNENLF
jgi:hypothetical protein